MSSYQQVKLCVVIAAYNEADNIAPLTLRLISTLDAIENSTWELIFVIEGTDETRAIAQSFAAHRPEIRILYNPEPSGLANAFRKGFDVVAPDTDVVVTMDADLNHQPEEIPRLVNALFEQGAGIVVGSRKVEGSSTRGTPLWKRSLSDAVNRSIKYLIRMPVADLTSGYRVYRYDTFKRISFSNSGFAFLPEILVRAHESGERIIEEPIEFIFRVAGDSKMAFSTTAMSYLRLLGARCLAWPTLAAVVILVSAVVLRLLVAFPVHKYQADADGVLSGLCAFRVLQGQHPVFFPGGYRLGAQSCYVSAAAFALFGVSRQSLALTGLLFSLLFVLFMYLYLREAVGPRGSLPGLLLAAFPPLQFLINTYVAWAYGEILMYCASSLWLGSVLDKRKVRLFWFFAFGISTGLALWCSVQSLMITMPIVLWLLLRRDLNSIPKITCAITGVLIGTLPISLFLVRGGASQVFGDAAVRSAHDVAQVLSNASYLIFINIPWLLVEKQANELNIHSTATWAMLLYIAAAVFLFCLAVLPNTILRNQSKLRAHVTLITLVLIFCAGLYVFSAAGSIRGWTTRYILPMYLAMPVVFAILCAALQKTWRVVLLTCTACFLVWMNIRAYPFSASPIRQSLHASLVSDEQLIRWLEQNRIRAVIGDYWDVYSLNFDSHGAVSGIPVRNEFDYLSFAHDLGGRRVRWAILDHTPGHLVAWQRRLKLEGDVFPVGADRFLLVPDISSPAEGAKSFLKLARTAEPR